MLTKCMFESIDIQTITVANLFMDWKHKTAINLKLDVEIYTLLLCKIRKAYYSQYGNFLKTKRKHKMKPHMQHYAIVFKLLTEQRQLHWDGDRFAHD